MVRSRLSVLLLGTILSNNGLLSAMDPGQQEQQQLSQVSAPDKKSPSVNELLLLNAPSLEEVESLWNESLRDNSIDLKRMSKEGLDPLLPAIEDDTPESVAIVDFLVRKGTPLHPFLKPNNHFGVLLTCEQDFERRLEKLRLLLEGGMIPMAVFIDNKFTAYWRAVASADCNFTQEQQATIHAIVTSFGEQKQKNGLELYNALPGILGEFLPPVTHSIVGEYAQRRYKRPTEETLGQKLERIDRAAEEGMRRRLLLD